MISSDHNKSTISDEVPLNLGRVRIMETENGILGRFFGGSKQAPINIAGLTLILLFFLLVYLFVEKPETGNIDLIVSTFTMTLGFLFGGVKGTAP